LQPFLIAEAESVFGKEELRRIRDGEKYLLHMRHSPEVLLWESKPDARRQVAQLILRRGWWY